MNDKRLLRITSNINQLNPSAQTCSVLGKIDCATVKVI